MFLETYHDTAYLSTGGLPGRHNKNSCTATVGLAYASLNSLAFHNHTCRYQRPTCRFSRVRRCLSHFLGAMVYIVYTAQPYGFASVFSPERRRACGLESRPKRANTDMYCSESQMSDIGWSFVGNSLNREPVPCTSS
jgi:hypothetical protein